MSFFSFIATVLFSHFKFIFLKPQESWNLKQNQMCLETEMFCLLGPQTYSRHSTDGVIISSKISLSVLFFMNHVTYSPTEFLKSDLHGNRRSEQPVSCGNRGPLLWQQWFHPLGWSDAATRYLIQTVSPSSFIITSAELEQSVFFYCNWDKAGFLQLQSL